MENEANVSKLYGTLESRGVTRRDFMKLCAAVAAAAGVANLTAPKVAEALESSLIGASEGNLFPVIWIEGASCTGCTESFAQVTKPDPATIILEMISLNYCETLSAGAGHSIEAAKDATIEEGGYILVYEGGVLKGWGGEALRVGDAEGVSRTGAYHLEHAAGRAEAVVALGSCAVNGGWMAAYPDPSQAVGVQQYLSEVGIATPVINIPGCPANPEWLTTVLVEVVLMGQLPALDGDNKTAAFSQTIHDNCERRGHFENGEFVYEFGSKEEAMGYCLYPLGCRGPQTKSNCPVVRWNDSISWCVQSGAPCIGCCEANPRNPGENWVEVNTPFLKRHRDLRIGDFVFQPGTVALAIVGIVAGALVIHGFGMKISGRMDGGADFEKIRKWDAKHPDRSIGKYDVVITKDAKKSDDDSKGGKA